MADGLLKDRRVIIAGGAAVALLAGVGIASAIMARYEAPSKPPPASQGGLIVETGRPDDGQLDPMGPLRCFVDGQFVGELTLAECAQRNGVATGALDVGVDETGALSAAQSAGTIFTPLPPQPVVTPAPQPAPTPAAPVSGPVGTCWRYANGNWRQLATDMTRNNCVQALFAGQCERRGGATYGRWGEQTLRLVPGRVEVSNDNRRFRTLVEQASGCTVPPID